MKKKTMTMVEEEATHVYPIYPLASGGYKIRIYLFNPLTKKREQVPDQSRKWTYLDARRRYIQLDNLGSAYFIEKNELLEKAKRAAIEESTDVAPKIKTMDELFDRFMEYRKNDKPSYHEAQKIVYKTHIKKFFENIPLKDITKSIITDWINGISNAEKADKYVNKRNPDRALRNSTKNNIATVLRNIFDYAIKREGINLDFDVPHIKSNEEEKEIVCWNADDCNKFLSMILEEDLLYTALFSLVLAGALRISEARALHPSKIDFINKKVLINSTLSRKEGQKFGQCFEELTTKGKKKNYIGLDDFELDLLKKQIDSIKNIHGYDPTTFFVFGGAQALGMTTVRRKMDYYKAKMKAKYPLVDINVTLHGLRHSAGSDVANTYNNVTAAKELLNHRHLSTTSRYIHSTVPRDIIEKRSKALHAKRTD